MSNKQNDLYNEQKEEYVLETFWGSTKNMGKKPFYEACPVCEDKIVRDVAGEVFCVNGHQQEAQGRELNDEREVRDSEDYSQPF